METGQPTNLVLWYFGTNIDRAGHYIFIMGENRMQSSNISYESLPFSPEALALKDQDISNYMKGTGLKLGDAKFFQIKGHSIWYIEGAPGDSRGGCKSVWWVQKLITKEELKTMILANAPSIELINAMRDRRQFEINWDYESQDTQGQQRFKT